MNEWFDEIKLHMDSLFSCSRSGDEARIETPFTRLDGDMIDLYLSHSLEGLLLSDGGETPFGLKR